MRCANGCDSGVLVNGLCALCAVQDIRNDDSRRPSSDLRDAVMTWIEVEKKADANFVRTRDAINRELDAVGGYATTSVRTCSSSLTTAASSAFRAAEIS